ncbi:MAG: 3-deoxy-D-manno-octulosonic acid transferase [Saprospiraceae bacterium]|nr:3-deoxy-D-manno-octulosonic acid transferase [Saprospiraceae bacterium]
MRKNYEFADYVCYLPLDTAANAKRFLAIVRPSLVVFVKYEFWYHYLQELKNTRTPTLLISAIFHPKQPFFQVLFGKFFQRILFCFSTIHVQNTTSAQLLQSIGFSQFKVTGDTRIDRVLDIPLTAKQFPIIEDFRGEAFLLVAGSTWQPDEAILATFIQQNQNKKWKYLIAPHDISHSHIYQLQQKLKVRSLRYTQAEQSSFADWEHVDVLILDTIGMLSQVYQYGKLAYIGGGFGRGIHNILEPAAFGLPVIIGPNYKKFEEANQLVDQKGCFSINNQVQFNEIFTALAQEDIYYKANQAITGYLANNQGASKKAMTSIQELLSERATK